MTSIVAHDCPLHLSIFYDIPLFVVGSERLAFLPAKCDAAEAISHNSFIVSPPPNRIARDNSVACSTLQTSRPQNLRFLQSIVCSRGRLHCCRISDAAPYSVAIRCARLPQKGHRPAYICLLIFDGVRLDGINLNPCGAALRLILHMAGTT